MRGASYMDDYDAGHTDNEYAGTRKQGGLSGCAKCNKTALMVVNFIMLLIGVALIAVVAFMTQNVASDVGFDFSGPLVVIVYIVGALVVLVSIVGCCGAHLNNRAVLIFYVLLLLLCLVLELAGILIIFADDSMVRNSFENRWDNMSTQEQTDFESDNNCSGFDGCYDALANSLERNMVAVGVVTIAIFVYQFVLTISACCLCCKKKEGGLDEV